MKKDRFGMRYDPSRVGRRLKGVMENLGMSQAELARKTGLTAAAISQIINEEREPSLTSLCVILDVIPIKMEKLFS